MRLYAVALITWAAFVIASSEPDTANLNDEKAADYTDLPAKQIVQPYVTDVEARSFRQTDIEDRHSDDFANAGLSRSAVHAGEERGSYGVSTTDSSSPGSIYTTPLTETSIRLESTDKYPFKEYPSQEAGYTEDVLLVENAGNFGQKVQDPRDGTIVRTVVRTREDDEYSFQTLYSSTVSPLEDEDTRKRPYISAIQEPLVLALKEESNLAAVSPADDTEPINSSETPAANSDEIFTEATTENSPPGNVVSVLENDVVPEILPTPLARLSRVRNDTAGGRITERSSMSAKKSENVVRTSSTTTTVEIVPSFQAPRFSSPIVVAELPVRETQKMIVDYMDDAPETYGSVGNAKITTETRGFSTADSASITSAAMLNPLQVGITLVNANQAGLVDDYEQSAATDVEDYPRNDLQRLATVDKELVENNENQSRIDYQSENLEHEVGKRVEIDIQKVPDGSVEIQKSIELYHTAPIQEIHYPPEYIQTANLGVIETNNIGSLQRSKQPYDQIEQTELRPAYDIYRGNGQGEKSVVKAPAFSQKLNRHEYNVLEDDAGRPTVADYSSSAHDEQTPFELQPFKYNGMRPVLSGPSQYDDTLYDQSNVRHNFNGNDNGVPPRAKPVGTSTRQDAASEPAKSYVPSAYQYSVQQPQSSQPYDHQHPFRSPETIRRPEATQLLLRIIPQGMSVNGGFLVPIPRLPYPIEKTVPVPRPIETEKKIPVERLVEKKVQVQVPVPVPVPIPSQLYPVQVPVENRVAEKPIRLSHIYPLHIERVVEKKVPYTVQRLIVQPSPSYPLRLPAAYPAAYAAAPIDQPAHATVPLEKAAEKPAAAVSSRPTRPYRTDRPIDGSGPTETRFTTKIYYQKPQEAASFAGENLRGIAGGLTFVPQSETNASQFYGTPYGRPLAYDYNIDAGKNYVPAAHTFSNVKLVILPKKLGGHMILRPHTTTPSYAAVPSFSRQILYNLVEKDKAVKDEYVGPAPPRKSSQSKAFPQIIKSPQFSTSASQSLTGLRKSRQPEMQHHGSFRQSKMEYGFKPPMVPSIQYDENTASKVEN